MIRYRPLALAGLLIAALMPAVGAVATGDEAGRSVYLVQLDPPAGGPTAERLEAAVLQHAGVTAAAVAYRYRNALTGFAARLTAAEAARLTTAPGVSSVAADRRRAAPAASDATAATATGGGPGTDFLGLRDGIWARLGGPERAGDGMVVGVIDTGIDPAHPSFADSPTRDGATLYDGSPYPSEAPAGWSGRCEDGERFAGCNHKLIGARFFVEGFGRKNLARGEHLSPLDSEGHGTHTAATAAGNHGVMARAGGVDLGTVSGIAPRARIAAYKVCWVGRPAIGEQCADSDVVAAIDAAVSDGVDVLNISLGVPPGSASPAFDVALLRAAEAGVFVVVAAGNEGSAPGSAGLAAPPWVTTVGATTLNSNFEAVARLTAGDGAPLEVRGPALTGPLEPTAVIDGADAAADGASRDEARACDDGALDPARVKGRVVVCEIGGRENPGRVVADAGGAGLLLLDQDGSRPLSPLEPWVPAIRLTRAEGLATRRFAQEHADARIAFDASRPVGAQADIVAPFSSRGPAGVDTDVLVPSLAAPGVNVVAATTSAPVGRTAAPGHAFALRSGTSMASPHVAGAATLLRQLHPDRSASVLRSQLVTTAAPTLTVGEGLLPARPFDTGGGRIDPNRAADPGLVLDVPAAGYRDYATSTVRARDLNLPAIVLGGFPGSASVQRTVTSVDGGPGRWTVSVSGLGGVDVTVSPDSFDVAPGASQPIDIRLRRADAPFDRWTTGAVTLEHTDGRTVRLPLALRAVAVDVSPEVAVMTDQAGGSAPFSVETGFTGQLTASGFGLTAPHIKHQKIAEDHTGDPSSASSGVKVTDLEVPAGTKVFAAATTNLPSRGDTDLDLVVFRDDAGDGFGAEDIVGAAATAGGEESVVLSDPRPGRYRVSVVGYTVGGSKAAYDLATWIVDDPAPDDLTKPEGRAGLRVSGDPQAAEPGRQVHLTLEWGGVAKAALPLLGLVAFEDGSGVVSTTVVRLARISRAEA